MQMPDGVERVVAVDTETVGDAPYMVQWTDTPGWAEVLYADGRSDLSGVRDALSREGTLTVFHNALFDMRVLNAVGITPWRCTDTMFMAYLLGYNAIGLKTLAYRLCGMVLTPYATVVADSTKRKTLAYLKRVMEQEWPDPDPVPYRKNDGAYAVKKPRNIAWKVARLLKDYEEGKQGTDLRKRWLDMDGIQVVEDALGVVPQGSLDDIPEADAVRYAGMDADATLRVHGVLWPQIVHNRLEEPLARDIACVKMVTDMMQTGIQVDASVFASIHEELTHRKDVISACIEQDLTGKYINPNSRDQVMLALADARISVANTSSKALDKLRDNKLVSAVQQYRELSKLDSTYVRALPTFVKPDGRIHTLIGMTGTVTGRLTSSNPNLMNQPVRTAMGRAIRKAFVPRPGCVLLCADYSQIEMRMVAHCSGDSNLVQLFKDNKDVHAHTAARMFGIDISEVDDKKHRYPAKRTGFGIVYGIGAQGLMDVFYHEGVTAFGECDCEAFIDKWFQAYPGVRDYMSDVAAEARRYGYVRDMFGRIRYVPEVYSGVKSVQAEGLRKAGNAPVQSGAQGVIKQAMADLTPIYMELQKSFVCDPVLQVHDELIWEVSSDWVEVAAPVIADTMVNAVRLEVPVAVDVEIGRESWGELEAYGRWMSTT